jgi:DNA repair exonuclease SbcCD ATPase subunit
VSKRFYFDEFSEDIFDDEIQQYPSNRTICNILNQQQQRIADLEAKLAESEKENRELHTAINMNIPNQIAMKDEIERLHTCIDDRIAELIKENEQLKQQLAEKDEEIDERMMAFEKRCQEYYKSKEFTIEQLEKVKEFCDGIKLSQIYVSNQDITHTQAIIEYINQLIAEIKGE